MIADWILWMMGNTPGAYSAKDKWPVIFADLIDTAVPFVIALLFASPFIFLKLTKRKFTPLSIVLSLCIGGLLAYGAWWLNEWSYGYGVGVIHRELYGDEPLF